MRSVPFALAVIGGMLVFSASASQLLTVNVISRVFAIQYVNSSGSAFTIEVEGRQYLITAKHVVSGMEGPAQVRLRMYDPQVYDRWFWVDVTPIFCQSEKVDIVALAPSRVLSPSLPLEPTAADLFFSQQVFFLGYPNLFDPNTETLFLSDLPFVKAGILSTIDSRDRAAIELFIDGQNNRGFSGGPIVFYHKQSKGFRVAGVVSAYQSETAPIFRLHPRDRQPPIREYIQGLGADVNAGIVRGFAIEPIVRAILENPIGAQIQ